MIVLLSILLFNLIHAEECPTSLSEDHQFDSDMDCDNELKITADRTNGVTIKCNGKVKFKKNII